MAIGNELADVRGTLFMDLAAETGSFAILKKEKKSRLLCTTKTWSFSEVWRPPRAFSWPRLGAHKILAPDRNPQTSKRRDLKPFNSKNCFGHGCFGKKVSKTIYFGHVWTCFGYVWTRWDTFWTRLDTFGHRHFLDTFGHVWTRMQQDCHVTLRKLMDVMNSCDLNV